MYSPPTWCFVAAAMITALAFVVRYSVLMPQYRVHILLASCVPALILFGGTAVKHQSEVWPLLLYTDAMLAVTALTIPYGQLLRRAAVEQAAGRPVPQVPAWVAFPVAGLGLVLIVGEGILFR